MLIFFLTDIIKYYLLVNSTEFKLCIKKYEYVAAKNKYTLHRILYNEYIFKPSLIFFLG